MRPLRTIRNAPLLRYVCAVATIGIAVAARLLLAPLLGNQFPFPLLFLAILTTAWLAGFGPALVAVVLGTLSAAYFFLPPLGSFLVETPTDVVGLVLFVSTGLGIAFLGGSMHAARVRAEAHATAVKRANDELEVNVRQRTAELAQSHEAVQQSEARMAGIVSSAMDAIISVDRSQKIVLFNTAAEKLFRCPAAEALGKSLDRFIPPHYRQQHARHVEDFGKTGVTSRTMRSLGELSGLRADGVEFPIEASISQIAVAGEKIYTVILRDITQRKLAEKEAALLAAIVDSSFDAIIGKDLNSTVTSWNAGAERTFGYTANEMIGRSITVLIPPDRQSDEVNILSRIKRGESVQHFETVRVKKDGGLIDVSVTVSPIKDSNGTIIGASKVARDITESKRSEMALRDSETRLRLVLQAAQIGHWEIDPVTRAARCSDRNYRIFGYEEPFPEWGVHKFFSHLHPEDRERVKSIVQNGLANQQDWQFEARIIRVDQAVRWISIQARFFQNIGGHPLRVLGVCVDLTERKAAEEARLASESRYRTLFEYAPDGIIIADKKSFYLDANTSICRMLGYTREEFIGMHASSIVAPAELPHVGSAVRILSEQDDYKREWQLRRKDGSVFPAEVIATMMPDGNLMGMIRDITERRNAERALHEKEMRLHAVDRRLAEIVHGMTEACFALDTEWRFTFVNDRGETLLRRTREQMLGKTMWEIFGKLIGTPMEANYRRAMTERVPVAFEVFSPIAERWLDIRLFPTAEGIAAFLLDIHARKLGEVALHATQTRLNSALSAGSIGTWSWDIVNDCLVADEFTARAFSIDPAAATQGLPAAAYLQAVAEEDQPAVSENLAKAIKTCGSYDIEYRVRQRNGQFIWLQARGRVEGDALGNGVNFHGAVMDITARKQAEAALQESEDRFRTMANSMSQLAWIARPDGFIFWYNQRWYEYTGTTPAAMEGWGWQSVHDPVVLPKVMENWKAAIASGEPFSMEFPLRGADGKFRTFLTRGQPLKDSTGKVMQWFGTNTDVEALKQAEETVRHLNTELEQRVIDRTAQLEAANKELEAFSYSVSHDLRAPLRHLTGFSQLLSKSANSHLDEKSAHYVDVIQNSAARMGQLIDDLLDFSRMGRVEMRAQRIEMGPFVRTIMTDLRGDTAGREIVWKIGELGAAYADTAMLRQVWINLMSNAVKFTRGRTPATIEIGREPTADDQAIFFIRDNGAGFDMQFVEKLCGVFQRLHRQDEFEGTGIGLANVRRIIHRHGGKIWAEGAIDKGATFHFSLPNQQTTPSHA